ncbi:MAG: sel1 repeat family protein [Bradyrhizobium sp.]|nr:MAG: sel1 repeat family protein [Bradyrhizobium sp.]
MRSGRIDFRPAARRSFALLALTAGVFGWQCSCALALDASKPNGQPKIPVQSFSSVEQALQAGVQDLMAGDAQSSVQALTYAADGGQPLAQWKLGRMYARGEGVPRDDAKAYAYFERLVESYNEDDPDRPDIAAISNAFVAVGVYCLNGIANSEIKADPERALEMFQYAATNFGDSDAQYNLARMYMDGAAGLARNNMRAAQWLALAADKGHHPAQALLGHLLFLGEGVPKQRARGLMWLAVAKGAALGPKDEWIRDLYAKDWGAAGDDDREVAEAYISARGKDGREPPATVTAEAKTRGFIAGFVALPGMLRPFTAAPPPNFGPPEGEPPPPPAAQ